MARPGSLIYHQATTGFEFRPGAVFNHILLADEINRASPKTQSALLEVMQERQHTVDGKTYPLPRPAIVVATQNPIELEGTYRLPEAQLDRFLIKTDIGYPDVENEVAILNGALTDPDDIEPCTSIDRVQHMINQTSRVYASEATTGYIGQGPGRDPGPPLRAARRREATGATVLAHRIIVTPEAELAGRSADMLLDEIVNGRDGAA